jgi:esterase FrsA
VTTKFHGEVVEAPVHILSAPDTTKDTPVLVVTGGVDTWKMICTRCARTLTTGQVGQLGMGFGNHFSAHAGLTAIVDAAVVVGGPVWHTFTPENVGNILYGMKDIVGNALGYTEVPTSEQVSQPISPNDLGRAEGNAALVTTAAPAGDT